MTYILEYNIKEFYDLLQKRSFIKKIFLLENKDCVKVKNNEIKFIRSYSNKDINSIKSVDIPEDIKMMSDKYLSNINILVETVQTSIKQTENMFIIKYSSIILEPTMLSQLLGQTKILLFIVCQTKTDDENKIIVQFYKKFQPESDKETIDDLLINIEHNDVIHNIFEEDNLKINEGIINLSSMFIGSEMVNDICIPFIQRLYRNVNEVIQESYISRVISYLKKKNITIFKRKT